MLLLFNQTQHQSQTEAPDMSTVEENTTQLPMRASHVVIPLS